MSFIAMNRFKVALGKEEAFETIWRERESRLQELEGFIEFRMLKGPENADEGYCLYASHTLWGNRAQFEAWTKSEQFRDAHKNAGRGRTEGVMVGHPSFEGFDTVLQQTA